MARTELGRPQRLIVAGHTDTVPVNGNLPARQEGDVLWGVGAADMKSGLAVMLALACGVAEPAVDVTYVFYEAEEVDAALQRPRPPVPGAARSAAPATSPCSASRPTA